MAETLDVLLLESHPHAADEAAASLEAHGHRVQRCHDDPEYPFPCRGLTSADGCPLDGHIDVAVLAQRGRHAVPTDLQGGVRCAIRARVPVVETGAGTFDPFGPWVTSRIPISGDVVAACAAVVDRRFDDLRELIDGRIARLLAVAGIDPKAVTCTFDVTGTSLDVHLSLPGAVSHGIEQGLAVRVLDAVRADGRTFGRVDVHVHTGAADV